MMVMRSKLFVPCARPELFAKALAGDADALSFDLEDSVPEAGKAAARDALVAVLASDAARATPKTLIVRVNAFGTTHFQADIAALSTLRVDVVNLPKIDSTEAVRAAVQCGISQPLLLNIETASAMLNAAAIAAAHPQVAGLQVGLNDLFAATDIARTDVRAVHTALWTVRMASGAAGCFAYDGAWPDLGDMAGFRAEAEMARSLGYRGKSCIHPQQVPIANQVFDTGSALAAARRILDAAAAADAAGHGAFVVDGKMVDRPAVAQARALVAAADRPQ
jgi:citrate lyase subunit beta/citryl-CoA lyase